MEGNGVRSRLGSFIFEELPFPLRWLAREVLRALHWLDRGAGRMLVGLRASPAWYFVTIVGTFAVFLTMLLFVSLVHETSGHPLLARQTQRFQGLGRRDLERIHEWSVQDKWRIAHFFVPGQPTPKHREIELDSRLIATQKISTRDTASVQTWRGARRNELDPIDVRLDLFRPKTAQQPDRLTRATVHGLGADLSNMPNSRLRHRDPRLLVQASWEFGSDCNRFEFVSLPRRRPIVITVPTSEPDPEPVFVPMREPIVRSEPLRVQTHPNLEIDAEMVRWFHLSTLPPGARIDSVSARSVMHIDHDPYSLQLAASHNRHWRHYDASGDHAAARPIPYYGVSSTSLVDYTREQADEYDPNLPQSAEVALRLELNTPHSVAGGEPQSAALTVRNEGPSTISRIELREDLSRFQTVVDAAPAAVVEPEVDPASGSRERFLLRQSPGLSPDGEQQFGLTWLPEGERRQFYRGLVTAHAEVSAYFDVIRPVVDQQMTSIPPESLPEKQSSLECDVQHLDRVLKGEQIDLEIVVRNTGETVLHDVKVEVEIPEELSHQDGKSVLFRAGDLPIGGSQRTVLKLSAVSLGEATNQLKVKADEPVQASGKTIILVVDRSKSKSPVPQIPETITSRPTVSSNQGNCSCQNSVSYPIGYYYPYPQ